MGLKSKYRVCRLVAALAAISAAPYAIGTAAAASYSKEEAPIPQATLALMHARDTTPSAPILIRSYKKEAELEVWKKNKAGRYVHLKTFPICRWSGQLGPKRKQGDRQAPEGFYSVAPSQMNPNSAYHLSFNIGYPNAYDRAHGATGAHLMVHGTCSSAGCYAMTDAQIEEIYSLAREAFRGGQQAFQFQAFPFRMTAQNMAKHRADSNIDFWRQLKEGSDRFEATGEEPGVGVAGGRYAFAPYRDRAKEALASKRHADEEARIAALNEQSAAIRTAYADGGQHASFAALAKRGVSLGMVSRPEALAFAGREIVIARAKRQPIPPVETTASIASGPDAPQPTVSASLASPSELSVFTPAQMGVKAPGFMASLAPLPGSTPILPASLTKAKPQVFARLQ